MITLDVLLIGEPDFIATVESRYGSVASTVISVESSVDVLPHIQQARPDVVILSFTIQVEQHIGQQLRQSNASRGVYCLVLDDRDNSALPSVMLDSIATVERSALAIETGADAYCPMQLQVESAIAAEQRLLKAYLQVANQQVSRYRELSKANDFLSTIALADPLTELGNRRALEWELPRQAQKAKSRQFPLSLIILDVDYFKLVNDHHGHLTGDRVLQLLAKRLKGQIRGRDAVFRYGGEEFVVLLSKTDLIAAEAIAGRLRLAIAEQPFTIDRELSLPITVSLGVSSCCRDDDGQGKSLLHRADQHLLIAKSQGRNQVISDRSARIDA